MMFKKRGGCICMLNKILIPLFIIITCILIFIIKSALDTSTNSTEQKWLSFKDTHQCVLKEIDETSFGRTYSWLCDDGIIYKNNYKK